MGYVSAYTSCIIKRLTCVLKEWSEDSDLSQFFEPENLKMQGRDFTDKCKRCKYSLTVFCLPGMPRLSSGNEEGTPSSQPGG